jgi:hypothetical protein
MQYMEFADKMIRAVHGKSRYGEKVTKTMLGDFVSKSQEAFTMLLYHNGYDNWVYMKNDDNVFSSDASAAGNGDFNGGCPQYKYTARSIELTSRNGGWSSEGMRKFSQLYTKVKEDRRVNEAVYDPAYKLHCLEKSTTQRKRKRHEGGQLQSVPVMDDIGDLLGSLTDNDNQVAI